MNHLETKRSKGLVILSAAKDLLAGIKHRKKILRCAQDDRWIISRHKTKRPYLPLVAALLCLTASCRDREAPAVDIPVFIISVDTLRADRLPAYGYAKGLTPAIDQLRTDAILFEQAYSHVPLTLPSHASLFTGLLPPDHGVRDNIGYALSPELPTLAHLLRSQGYATGAAVSTWVLRKETGIAEGFDYYDDETDPARQAGRRSEERDGERSRQSLTAWLHRQSGSRLFGFLHLFEPHAPYEPPAPFDLATDRYDGEISYADAIVGRFLDDLRARGLYDSALIIFLSDHGEGLGDHGEDEHGVFLYRESIQVPLIVKLPANERAGETVRNPVGLIDIVPTILAVTGMADPSRFSGAVLTLPDTLGNRTVYAETYFPRLHLGWSELFAMMDSRFHFIAAPRSELYESSDVAQKQNVLEQNRRVVFAFSEQLRALDRKFALPSSVDPEDRQRLAALGYIGSSQPSEGPLPDPKDHIGSLRELKMALASFQDGAFNEALLRSRRLLDENPLMVDGWMLQAAAQRQLGRREEALSTVRTGLRRFPTHPDLQLTAAELLLELGRLDDAAAHADLALSQDEHTAREMLARIALARDDPASAEKHLETDIHATVAPSTLLLLAEIRKRQRRFPEELAAIDRAIAEMQRRGIAPTERLHYERGIALLELRQPGAAGTAFREEIRLFPGNLEAWGMLAVVLAVEGNKSEAREILREVVRVNPGAESRKIASDTLRLLE